MQCLTWLGLARPQNICFRSTVSALLNGDTQIKTVEDRYQSYIKALEGAGIKPNKNYVVEVHPRLDLIARRASLHKVTIL